MTEAVWQPVEGLDKHLAELGLNEPPQVRAQTCREWLKVHATAPELRAYLQMEQAPRNDDGVPVRLNLDGMGRSELYILYQVTATTRGGLPVNAFLDLPPRLAKLYVGAILEAADQLNRWSEDDSGN